MEKIADVYLSSDGVIRIGTRATTTLGLPIGNGPVYFLKDSDNPEKIGLKALEALDGFQDRAIPHPENQDEWRAYSVKWKKDFKITSERSFLKKGAKWLLIKINNDLITISPTRNNITANIKSDVLSSFLEHKNRTCSIEPEELGRSILAAFDDCE